MKAIQILLKKNVNIDAKDKVFREILINLPWIEMETGRVSQAVPRLEELLSRRPNGPIRVGKLIRKLIRKKKNLIFWKIFYFYGQFQLKKSKKLGGGFGSPNSKYKKME